MDTNISVPVSIGEKIYFYTTFKCKLYILSSPVAEIEITTNKNGTSYILKTNNGHCFKSEELNQMFFVSEETAVKEASARIESANSANAKLGSGIILGYGGVIN